MKMFVIAMRKQTWPEGTKIVDRLAVLEVPT